MSKNKPASDFPKLSPSVSPSDNFNMKAFESLENLREGIGGDEHDALVGIEDPEARYNAYRETDEFKETILPLYQRSQAMYGKDNLQPERKVAENLSPEKQELVLDIRDFLEEHAVRETGEGYEPDNVAYVIEDATHLHEAMETILAGENPKSFESSWDSGAYKPFSSDAGRAWHDDLMQQISDLG